MHQQHQQRGCCRSWSDRCRDRWGLNNSGCAIDVGQCRTIQGSIAVDGCDGGDVGCISSTSREGAVEAGRIAVEISEGLNNSSGCAIDVGQCRSIKGSVAIDGLNGSDVCCLSGAMVESKLEGSLSRSPRAVTTAAAVPSMSVSAEPSRVPSPLTAAMEEMSVASAAPAERVLSKLAGSLSRSAGQ